MRNFLRYSVSYLFVILQWKWNARKWGNKGNAFQPLQHHGLFGVNILSSSLMYYINIFVKVWCRNISSFIPNKLQAICRWGTPFPVTAAVIATAAAAIILTHTSATATAIATPTSVTASATAIATSITTVIPLLLLLCYYYCHCYYYCYCFCYYDYYCSCY